MTTGSDSNIPTRPIRAWIVAAIATGIGVMGLTVFLTPVAYDTGDFGDTLFILGAAWRQHHGLQPALDFGYFYGGFTSWVVAWAMALFGPSVHAFDQALLILLAAFALAVAAVGWRRTSVLGAAIGLLVVATLIFARFPLEWSPSVTRLVSTHSFLYNRIGLAIVVVCGVYAGVPGRSRPAEAVAGALVGGLLVAVSLTKPTFVILAPAVLLALAVQARWVGLGAAATGFLVAMLVADPGGARWWAGLEYSRESLAHRDDAGILPLIRKAVLVPLAQPVALTVTAFGMVALLVRSPRMVRPFTGAVLVAGVALGMTATMGGGGALGHLALPILAMVALVAAELAESPMAERPAGLGPLQAAALVLAVAFAVPHALNLVGSTWEGYSRRSERRIEQGPFRDYLSVVEDDEVPVEPGPDQYEMLADGVSALARLGDVSDRGIIADTGLSFEFAMEARPVPGYPLWQREGAPEFAPDVPLAPEADIALLGRTRTPGEPSFRPMLLKKMAGAFTHCLATNLWDVYIRRDLPRPDACSSAPTATLPGQPVNLSPTDTSTTSPAPEPMPAPPTPDLQAP